MTAAAPNITDTTRFGGIMNTLRSTFVAVIMATACLFTVLVAAPAQAVTPGLEFPLYRTAANATGDALVQLELPGRAYGLRRWAKNLDASVDGLTIFTTGTCSARPEAVCVRYEVGTWDAAQMAQMSDTLDVWAGLTTFPSRDHITVYIQAANWGKRVTVAHELGHVLGLGHHEGKGLMSLWWPTTQMNATELQLLRDWFAVPRFAG